MKIYLYAHTGHRTGLDHLRRLIPLARSFQELGDAHDVMLLVNDVRARAYAREEGVARVATLDGVQDLANLVESDDLLIYSSPEAGEAMLAQMAGIYPYFVRFDDSSAPRRLLHELVVSPAVRGEGIVQALIVDPKYFVRSGRTLAAVLFMGDSDYSEELMQAPAALEGTALLAGRYFSIDLMRKIGTKFATVHDEESYDAMITGTTRLMTASAQSALEVIAGGGDAVFFAGEEGYSALGETLLFLTENERISLKTLKNDADALKKDKIYPLLKADSVGLLRDHICQTYLAD